MVMMIPHRGFGMSARNYRGNDRAGFQRANIGFAQEQWRITIPCRTNISCNYSQTYAPDIGLNILN